MSPKTFFTFTDKILCYSCKCSYCDVKRIYNRQSYDAFGGFSFFEKIVGVVYENPIDNAFNGCNKCKMQDVGCVEKTCNCTD